MVARLHSGVDADGASAALNRALIDAGVDVFAIGPRARSLEGIYRDVTTTTDQTQPEIV